MSVSLLRFEQELFQLDTTRLPEALNALTQRYPDLMPLFVGQLIHDQSNPEETPLEAIGYFLNDPLLRSLYDTVQLVYGNLGWLEKDLNRMFQYHAHYFPERPIPRVVTLISAFATDAFTYGDSLCGIGLDMFLGEHFLGYHPEIFPQYVRRQFTRDYMEVRLAKVIAQNIVGEPQGMRLIDQIIHRGKAMYIVDCLLPHVPDSLKMGYTAEQMAGCYANEREAWARLLDLNLLYSTDYVKYRKLVEPSPNAPVLFEEAPGEVGVWLGWRIVRQWAKRHPESDMRALLAIQDGQKLLQQARYKPSSK